ncbi:MAG: fucose permease [Kangiellaceae bacterium]|jgi:fucose permease
MPRFLIIFAIAACYFVFAILLNSVGTVILQSINSFDIGKADASLLEGYKDLPIAIVSFLVASIIPRIGYRFALLLALFSVSLVCLITPIMSEFWAIKLLFATIGTAFAFVKVSVYSIIGQLSPDTKSHSSLLNTIEGIFMVGVLSGYWVFSFYIDGDNPSSMNWLNVYYPLAGVIIITALVVLIAPIEKPPAKDTATSVVQDFIEMLKLTYQPLVLVFVISVFMYVLIEQGVGTWLPTFNSKVLLLPADISVQITSIFAAMIAIGRLGAGFILRKVHWYFFLNICLIGMGAILLLTLPLASNIQASPINSLFDAPIAAFLIPLVGLMMAPIYPVINSVILSSLAVSKQSQMTGLIIVFSALGGTTGSMITGALFDKVGGQKAFYLILLPIALLIISLGVFRKLSKNMESQSKAANV